MKTLVGMSWPGLRYHPGTALVVYEHHTAFSSSSSSSMVGMAREIGGGVGVDVGVDVD